MTDIGLMEHQHLVKDGSIVAVKNCMVIKHVMELKALIAQQPLADQHLIAWTFDSRQEQARLKQEA